MGEAKRCQAIRRANERQAASGWDANGAPTTDWPQAYRRVPHRPAGAPPDRPYEPPASALPLPPPRVVGYVGTQTDGTVMAKLGDVEVTMVLLPLSRPGRLISPLEQAPGVLRVISSTDEQRIAVGERVRFAREDEDAWMADILEDEKRRRRRESVRTIRPVLSISDALIAWSLLEAHATFRAEPGPTLVEPPAPRRKR